MSPKEKAKELVDKMSSQTYSYQPYAGAHYQTEEIGWEAGKKCALIAVNEILKTNEDKSKYGDMFSRYWEEVANEIEKI